MEDLIRRKDVLNFKVSITCRNRGEAEIAKQTLQALMDYVKALPAVEHAAKRTRKKT